MARPRPLRAELRPCVRAAVLAGAPDRVRAQPRRPEAVPSVGLAHTGAPRARFHARDRGDDRAARTGLRQRRRHGDRRAVPRRALQPPGAASRRSPHLRGLLRRRPDGGDQPGSRLDRRALRARQARGLLRRQPHHDRRLDDDQLRRREPRGTPSSRWLARAAGRGLRGSRRARARAGGRARRSRAPVVYLDPLAYRLSGSQCREHGRLARVGAGRGGGARDKGGDGLRSRQALLGGSRPSTST